MNHANESEMIDQSIQKSINTSMKSMSQLPISQEAVPNKTIRSTVKTMSSNNDMGTQTNSQSYTLYRYLYCRRPL
jgi:hypothetical protein